MSRREKCIFSRWRSLRQSNMLMGIKNNSDYSKNKRIMKSSHMRCNLIY